MDDETTKEKKVRPVLKVKKKYLKQPEKKPKKKKKKAPREKSGKNPPASAGWGRKAVAEAPVPERVPGKRGPPGDYRGQATVDMVRKYTKEYGLHGHMIPSIAGLATHLGIARETVRAWQHHPEKADFKQAVRDLLAVQEQVLLTKGLDNEFNPTITKLVLGKHGYSDRQDTTHKIEPPVISDGSLKLENGMDVIDGDYELISFDDEQYSDG